MKRRCNAPDRFDLEDPSFDRQIQRALQLSLSPARRDPETTSSSDKTPDDVFEPTAYLGVERNSVSGRFRVTIKKTRGHPHVLGWYATCTEAAAAYDEAARRVFGDKAETNFEKGTNQPLFHAPLPWKTQEDAWKPRPPSWYEALISEAIENYN